MPEQSDNRDDPKSNKLDLAPETTNMEQDEDEEAQAQAYAKDARRHVTQQGLEESEKVSTGDLGDDVKDLTDRMREMDKSGRIDMDAYRGEPAHDDNVDKYGKKRNADELRGEDPLPE
jgi:hypothetical protein